MSPRNFSTSKIFFEAAEVDSSKMKDSTEDQIRIPKNLMTYFNFGFYLGVIPFKIKSDQKKAGCFLVHKFLPQQVSYKKMGSY